MKKIILIIILSLNLSSCSIGSYYFINESQKTGLDFTQGKWLLNEIDCPIKIREQLTKITLKKFSKQLPGRIDYIYDVKGLLVSKKINFNPNKSDLEKLKIGTGYDYFINIKASAIKDELGAIDLTNHRFSNNSENKCSVLIEVYDLKNLQIIYSKKIIGTSSSQKDNGDVHFVTTTNYLIIGGINRILKNIDKKSIKNK